MASVDEVAAQIDAILDGKRLGALQGHEAEGRMVVWPPMIFARMSRANGRDVARIIDEGVAGTSASTSVSSIRSASGRNSSKISAPPITEIVFFTGKRKRLFDVVRDLALPSACQCDRASGRCGADPAAVPAGSRTSCGP